MDAAYYQEQFGIEDSHWWYVGRRRVLSKLLQCFRPSAGTDALEIGCGGGGNLPLLARLGGEIAAVEMEPEAVETARSRRIGNVQQGKLGDDLAELRKRYDIVAMFDVLEHIEDDAGALRQTRDLLSPGGRLFMTVPAYSALWTQHDVVAHHYRRYTRKRLIRLLRDNGYRVVYASYFNTLLFPLALVTLLVSRLFNLDPEGAIKQPAGPINAALRLIFSGEARLLPRLRLPYGLSIAVVAERA